MFYEVIGLITHSRIRITYKRFAFLFPCKTGKYIYIAVQQFLIQVTEIAVYILVIPPGILGQLLIVFIGIASLDGTLFGAFLEHFILVIAHPNCYAIIINSKSLSRKQYPGQHYEAYEYSAACNGCFLSFISNHNRPFPEL